MARKFGGVKYPQTDFRKLKLRFLAEKKFGKTSFFEAIDFYFRNKLGLKEDEFSVFIASFGSERGTDAIMHDGTIIETFEDYVSLVDDIESNPDEYPSIIGHDTENELVRLAEEFVVKMANKDRSDGAKRVKSVKAAYGGYNNGPLEVGNVIKEQLGRLSAIGKGVITNGHTKRKEIKDKTSEEVVKYETVTSNLISTYDNPFAEFADIIMIGYYSYNENEDGELETVDRIISMSSKNDRSIGSGSRFLGMPEKVKLITFEEGASPDEQFKTNLENGATIISSIEMALYGNAKARGISLNNVPQTVVEPKERKGTQQKKDSPSKSNKEKYLSGEELWSLVAKKTKGENGKELKKQIAKICGATQGSQVKGMIANKEINNKQIKEINDLLK